MKSSRRRQKAEGHDDHGIAVDFRHRREGQGQKDEHDHHQAIDDPFHDHRGEAGRDIDVFSLFQDIGAQQLTGPEGKDIVAKVANTDHGKEPHQRDQLEWAQGILPTPGAQPETHHVDGNRWDQPPIFCCTQRFGDSRQVQARQSQVDKKGADCEPDQQLPVTFQTVSLSQAVLQHSAG